MRILCFFIFLTLTVVTEFAQENNSPKNDSWVRFESPKKDFSVSMPSSAIIDIEKGTYRMYSYEDGNIFHISMEDKSTAKTEFQRYVANLEDKKKYEFFQSGDFIGMQYAGEKKPDDNYYYLWLNMASSKGEYTISLNSKKPSNEDFLRVLSSIRLDGKPLFTQKAPSVSEEKIISVSSLQSGTIVLSGLKQKDSEQSKLLKADKNLKEEKDSNVYSRGLIILRKPRPAYTMAARESRIQGVVRLKVTFLANGQIGPVFLVSSLKGGLDKEAFKAVKKIKFLPAEIAGKPVDVTRLVDYSFSVY